MRQRENKGGRARLNEDELDTGKAETNPFRNCNRHKCERPPETARPVTVLPTLNIIFETLLSGHMYEFYTGLLSDITSAHRKFCSC